MCSRCAQVFNVTSFLNEHPGGKKVILKEAGKDATAKFDMFHKAEVLMKCGVMHVEREREGQSIIAPLAPFFSCSSLSLSLSLTMCQSSSIFSSRQV